MAENKTQPTEASVEAYLDGLPDPARRRDCKALAELMGKATRESPRMWGPSIVGFGSRHYAYESGREGDTCVVGFSSRKDAITLYGLRAAPSHEALLPKLGRHKEGKGCVYLRSLSEVDLQVLERLVTEAAQANHQAHRACP